MLFWQKLILTFCLMLSVDNCFLFCNKNKTKTITLRNEKNVLAICRIFIYGNCIFTRGNYASMQGSVVNEPGEFLC